MQLSNWLFFCSVSLLVTFTPGPAVLMAITNAITVGLRRAAICSLGNAFGLLLVSTAAMAGMGLVLRTSATAFTAIKLAGAGYLIYLGIRQWRNGTNFAATATEEQPTLQTYSARRLFGQGLTMALTNPKAILFFSALFPQFLVPTAPVGEQFCILTLTFAACALFSHFVYILLAQTIRKQLQHTTRAKLFNKVTGSIFLLLGVSLLRLPHKAA